MLNGTCETLEPKTSRFTLWTRYVAASTPQEVQLWRTPHSTTWFSFSVQIREDFLKTQWKREERCDICHLLFLNWRESVGREVQDPISATAPLVWGGLWRRCILLHFNFKPVSLQTQKAVIQSSQHSLHEIWHEVLKIRMRTKMYMTVLCNRWRFPWQIVSLKCSPSWKWWTFLNPMASDCIWRMSQSQKRVSCRLVQTYKNRSGRFGAAEQTPQGAHCLCKRYRLVDLIQ